MDKGGRQVEDSIHNSGRVIWTYGYVLWTNQFSNNVPNNNEWDLTELNQY